MSDSREMCRHIPFPFPSEQFPERLGAVVQRTVLDGTEPAREVIHAADGSWAVGDGVTDPNAPDASVATHIWHAIERNSTVASLATLPPGYVATRTDPGDEWRIAPHEWDPDVRT